MINHREGSAVTVAAALYPLAGLWPPKPASRRRPARTRVLLEWLHRMRDGFAARRARHELMELDDRLLKDIGLSRCGLLADDIGADSPRARR